MSSGIIKKFFAAFLLLVFALSITPKRFVHNVFADHTDKQTKKSTDTSDQFTTFAYNCDDDNQVAEGGFISVQHIKFPLGFSFSKYNLKNNSFVSSIAIYSSLRGPPVTV